MYPDTDSPPTRVTRDRVERLAAELPPFPWDREKRYGEWGVPEETTHWLIRYGGADVVEEVVRRTGVDGKTAAIAIGQTGKAMGRKGVDVERLNAEDWVKVFDLHSDGRLPREMIPAVVKALAEEPGMSADEAASAAGIDLLPAEDWREQVKGIGAADYKKFNHDNSDRRMRWLTGRVVRMLKGRAPAREVAEFVKTELGAKP
jgi:glutamyl-tRNA(Gln) amidotransferase subunit E